MHVDKELGFIQNNCFPVSINFISFNLDLVLWKGRMWKFRDKVFRCPTQAWQIWTRVLMSYVSWLSSGGLAYAPKLHSTSFLLCWEVIQRLVFCKWKHVSSAWIRNITIAQAFIQHCSMRTIHLVKTGIHIHYPEQKPD